jgi:hypothetical protein
MMEGVAVLTEQTERFIAENPSDIAFTRHTNVNDGAGGHTTTTNDLSAQTVRVVQASPTRTSPSIRNTEGEVTQPDANLICMPDTDVQIGDTFQWNGLSMKVVWIILLPYEKVAEVVAG